MVIKAMMEEYLTLANSMLILYCFFQIQFSRNWKRYLLAAILPAVMAGSLYLLGKMNCIAPSGLVMDMICFFLVVDEKWIRRLAGFFVGYAGNSIILQFAMLSISIVLNRNITSNRILEREELINVISCCVLAAIVSYRRKIRLRRLSTAFLYLIGTILTLLCFLLTYLMQQHKSERWNMAAEYTIAFIALFVMGISYGLVMSYNLMKDYDRQNQLKDKYILMQQEYYKQIYENAMETKKVRHDMNGHLGVIGMLLEKKKYRSAEEYIWELNAEVARLTPDLPDVGDEVVNAILLLKYKEAQNKGIEIAIKTLIQKEPSFPAFDLCTIIMNLMNNAIEYCASCCFKKIEFFLGTYSGHLVIRVSNPVLERIDEDAILKRIAKPDNDKHGFGLANVRDVAEKYNGKMEFVSTDRQFQVIVTLLKN